MSESLFLWGLGAFVTGSCLMFWFNTGLPIHLFEILRLLGWRRSDNAFWSLLVVDDFRTDLANFTRQDFDEWAIQNLPRLLAELLGCPGCFSFHVSFWTAFVLFLTTNLSIFTLVAFWLSWPAAANIILRNTK